MTRLTGLMIALTLATGCADATPTASRQSAPRAPAGTPRAPAATPGAASGAAPAGSPATPAAPAAPANAEPLRIEPARIDFGFVHPHTTCESKAKIVNDTDEPRIIRAAQPSCQCTTVDLVGKTIPPRGSLEFPVSMKVSSTGVKLADVKIVFDGIDRVFKIDLKAEVVYSVRAVTQNKAGGSWDPYIDADTDPTRVRGEVTVASLDGKPFKVVSVGMKPPQFLDWTPDAAPKATYRVKYDVSARDCASMPRYLIVETDRADAPLIDMRVRHKCTHIKPKLNWAEFRANAGILSPGQPSTFDVEVKKTATPAGPIQITGASSTRPDIAAELVSQKFDGENTLVTIRLTPTANAKGVQLFPIRISATVPGQPPVVDDFLVYCKIGTASN